jgi:hypothetical protein
VKTAEPILVSSLAVSADRLRVALVTETFAPEVNGVAMTLGNLVRGLLQRGHTVQVVRPQQANESGAASVETARTGLDEVLAKGVPIPHYRDMRFGLLSTRQFIQLWRRRRPDIVHVATEGPLGWCAQFLSHQFSSIFCALRHGLAQAFD